MSRDDRPAFSARLESALRHAALWHRGQTRRGSELPYLVHPVAVAMILDRLGFSEDVVVAGSLHDAIEDTAATGPEIRSAFGPVVAQIVELCSETKDDPTGARRPWIDRKRDYLDAMKNAPVEARAVALADKLHNLLSIRHDLDSGVEVWSQFHAGKADVLWFYREAIDRIGGDEAKLARLARECREALSNVEAPAENPGPGR